MFSHSSFRTLDDHDQDQDHPPSPSPTSTPDPSIIHQVPPQLKDLQGKSISIESEDTGPDADVDTTPVDPHSQSRSRPRGNRNIHAPSPQRCDTLKPPITHMSHKENMDDFVPSSPQSFSTRSNRSPSRHHGLTALSPLQAFSPLQSTRQVSSSKTPSEAGSLSARSRASSVTRSLSRRDSLIAHAAKWKGGDDQALDDEIGSPNSFFSRLTLVKAPAEKSGLTKSKSSSSLAPFTSFAAASDIPATSARGPRRSFAASSFGGMSPLPVVKPSSMYSGSHSDDNDVQSRRKPLSPDQVVDIARQLASPVMLPDDGLKSNLLRRRKSAGASFKLNLKEEKDDKKPVALEPVEYRQMDEEALLPYIERASEVDELIKHPANEKLFKLLKAAFPKEPARFDWRRLAPEQWNWEELLLHLTQIDRDEIPDYEWIFRARRAVRQRSISLWEKLGTCLGCDGDLLNAGGEDGIPPSWGGLGLGDEGEYDPSMNQVWIEGLEAVDANAAAAKAETDLAAAFGEIVEDEGEQAAAGMTALLGTIGEAEEPVRGGPTTAQRAGNRDKEDPFNSPTAQFKGLPSPTQANKEVRQSRSKSFVGLQICTQASPPQPYNHNFARSPTSQIQTPVMENAALPVYERGPGSPMFPSSFSSLSVEPNLGRSASVALAGSGMRPLPPQEDFRMMRRGLVRKSSGAGLSESAITFASESDYATSHGDH